MNNKKKEQYNERDRKISFFSILDEQGYRKEKIEEESKDNRALFTRSATGKDKTMNKSKQALLNLVFLLQTLVINTFGFLGLFNGLTQKQVSDMYPTLITPSPFTFSIWSLIYSLLILSVMMMLIKNKEKYYAIAIEEISSLFKLSCVLNSLWIIAFSYVQLELSLLLIFMFLLSLTKICEKLLQINDGEHWLLPLTFGLYGGWLFLATVANTAATLVKLQWDGFGISPETWSILVLVVVILLVLYVLHKLKNAAFSLPVAWAYYGIYHALEGKDQLLRGTALLGMALLILLALLRFYRNHYFVLPKDKEIAIEGRKH